MRFMEKVAATDYGPRHETSVWFRGLLVSTYFDQYLIYLVNISTSRFGSNGCLVQVIKFFISFSFRLDYDLIFFKIQIIFVKFGFRLIQLVLFQIHT